MGNSRQEKHLQTELAMELASVGWKKWKDNHLLQRRLFKVPSDYTSWRDANKAHRGLSEKYVFEYRPISTYTCAHVQVLQGCFPLMFIDPVRPSLHPISDLNTLNLKNLMYTCPGCPGIPGVLVVSKRMCSKRVVSQKSVS